MFALSRVAHIQSCFVIAIIVLIIQKASSVEAVPGSDENHKKAILELRRALILGIVAGTDKSNPALDIILESFLPEAKTWLQDVLEEKIGTLQQAPSHGFSYRGLPQNSHGNVSLGGIDFLLHLLKNIAELPVTAAMVKNTGLGKLVGSIEKHRIFSGPNESNIRDRVDLVKTNWKASVKARKAASEKPPVAPKREAPTSNATSSPVTKRAKVADSSPKSSLSSLLQKVSSISAPSDKSKTANGVKTEKAKSDWQASNAGKNCLFAGGRRINGYALTHDSLFVASSAVASKKKKPAARVKWADHFGGELQDARLIEGENVVVPESGASSSESWNDRKKRDREKEKKLLATMKYVQRKVCWHCTCSAIRFISHCCPIPQEIKASR